MRTAIVILLATVLLATQATAHPGPKPVPSPCHAADCDEQPGPRK